MFVQCITHIHESVPRRKFPSLAILNQPNRTWLLQRVCVSGGGGRCSEGCEGGGAYKGCMRGGA